MGLFNFGKKKDSKNQLSTESVMDEQEMMYRLCSQAGNIIDMLKAAFKGEKGTDLYFVAIYAGGLAGIACHEAAVKLGEPMMEISCSNGKKYYMGDSINKYLHESKYSVTGFACAITQMPQSAVIDIVKKQTEALGTEEFVVEGRNPADLYTDIKSCWDGIMDNMTLKYCKTPEEWPILYGIVLQNILKESMAVAPKEAIFDTAVGVACAMAKMDKKSL